MKYGFFYRKFERDLRGGEWVSRDESPLCQHETSEKLLWDRPLESFKNQFYLAFLTIFRTAGNLNIR